MAGCVSALVCAFNEADRIEPLLRVLTAHPLVAEILVVDDGSTDRTAEVVRALPLVKLISYRPNRGKTHALAVGAEAASFDHLMLLDADLCGVDEQAITALAAPVLAGLADVTMSLRANSLRVYKMLGLDFVSGERVLPRRLIADNALTMRSLPRWGGEAFINEQIIRQQLRLQVVSWRGVRHTPKSRKVGASRGMAGDWDMIADALEVLTPLGVVRQNLALLKLSRRSAITGSKAA